MTEQRNRSNEVPRLWTRRAAGTLIVRGLAVGGLGYWFRYSQEQAPPAPYPFTTGDVISMTNGQNEVVVDPKNYRNMMCYQLDPSAGPQKRINTYISIDGGKSWAGLDRPIANGVNKDPNTQVIEGSYGGHDANPQAHAIGEVFQVTYRNGEQVTIQLGVASRYGIETIDIESKNMATIPCAQGNWSIDNRGNYSYELPGTDTQGQNTTLIVNEVSGK